MLISLTVFFIAATLYQAWSMQQRILDLSREEFKLPDTASGTDADLFRARVGLEAYTVRHRYQHAGLVLMSRAWIIYLGFVTGMILAMVGATFILGKIRESESEFGAKGQNLEVSLKSASPGLFLAFFGTVLMICTMVIRADFAVTDSPLYFLPEARISGVVPAAPPVDLTGPGRPAKGKLDDSILDSLRPSTEATPKR